MAYTFMTESPDEEKYNVKREGFNFVSHFSKNLILPDVTLVTEDNVERNTHKILLASISPFLKELMLGTEGDIVIHLQGISAQYLDLILEILNTGKTYPDNHIETIEFLEICLSLGIHIFNDKIMFAKEISNLVAQDDNKMRFIKRGIERKDDSLKKFKCLRCDKLFRLSSNLNHHVKGVHEKVRYPCQLCEKQFYDKRNLKKHNCIQKQREELAPKMTKKERKTYKIINCVNGKFKCSLCEKSVSSKNSLYKHIKGVHEKKRFNCKLCFGNYSDQSNLRKHVLSVHENINYSCHICDKVFSDQNNLRSHKRNKHGMCRCGESFQDQEEFKLHRATCPKNKSALHFQRKTKNKIQNNKMI